MAPYRERAEHAWTKDSVRLIVTPSVFAKSALFHVQEIGHFRTWASYFTERERLDSFLVVYTTAGRGTLTYRGITYDLLPGRVFFIDCMEYQYYACAPGEAWELQWVHLNGPTVRGYYEQFTASGGPIRQLAEDSPVPRMLQELLDLHRSKSMRNEWLASRELVGLLTELVLDGTDRDGITAGMPESVAGILRLIDKRYAEKLTLEHLAKTFSVNKYHLAKEFKKHTGFSPGEYIINVRITRAKELLKYSDLPVAAIAEQVGIDNVSHFINLFRDRVEQTPLAFRKTWQGTR